MRWQLKSLQSQLRIDLWCARWVSHPQHCTANDGCPSDRPLPHRCAKYMVCLNLFQGKVKAERGTMWEAHRLAIYAVLHLSASWGVSATFKAAVASDQKINCDTTIQLAHSRLRLCDLLPTETLPHITSPADTTSAQPSQPPGIQTPSPHSPIRPKPD
jgi:hypothetical protein